MGKETLTFGDIEIEKKKKKFTAIKILFLKKDVDIEKVLLSNKISSSEKNYKYFIDSLYHDYKVNPLQIMLPRLSAYVKRYDGQTKWMYFLSEDDDLLEKYNAIWDKVSADIKKPKLNLMVMKLQIFAIKKFLWWILIIFVSQ